MNFIRMYAILSGRRLKKKVALNIKKTFVDLLNWGRLRHTIVYMQLKLISWLHDPDSSISINQLFVGKRYYILSSYSKKLLVWL